MIKTFFSQSDYLRNISHSKLHRGYCAKSKDTYRGSNIPPPNSSVITCWCNVQLILGTILNPVDSPIPMPQDHWFQPLAKKNFLYWSSWSFIKSYGLCYHIRQPCILLSSWLPTWGIYKPLVTELTPHNELHFTLQSVSHIVMKIDMWSMTKL